MMRLFWMEGCVEYRGIAASRPVLRHSAAARDIAAMPQLFATNAIAIADLIRMVQSQTLYAVLDACDEPRVPPKVHELGSRATTLYSGSMQENLWAIAPYLVQVDENMLQWLRDNLWKEYWGIFVASGAGLAALRAHLRKFIVVTREDGASWYFRFYDPRVMASTLPTWDAVQIADFFGPVSTFGWVDPASGAVTLARAVHFGEPATAPRITLRSNG
jgi:uncharacterized protein DUF4123